MEFEKKPRVCLGIRKAVSAARDQRERELRIEKEFGTPVRTWLLRLGRQLYALSTPHAEMKTDFLCFFRSMKTGVVDLPWAFSVYEWARGFHKQS